MIHYFRKLFKSEAVDLFASRNNAKLDKFVSWHLEPESWRVDAFSLVWNNTFYYVFPLFLLLARSWTRHMPAWDSQPWLSRARHSQGCNVLPEGQGQSEISGTHDISQRRLHNPIVGIPFLGKYLDQFGLDRVTKDKLLSHAWRNGTVKLYANYLKKSGLYCLLNWLESLLRLSYAGHGS